VTPPALAFTLPSGAELLCGAVLFDMDGVLIDSLGVVERHLRTWATRNDLDPDEVVARSPGLTNEHLVRLTAPHLDDEAVAAETAFLVAQDRDDLDGVSACRGAADLLRELPPAAWAVVTSAYRDVAHARLRHTGLPQPKVLVTAEDVTHGKPHPEGYLSAARALGVPAGRCVVVEDAPSGVAAARAAGALPVGVSAHGGALRCTPPVEHTVRSVAELRLSRPGKEAALP
jgi:sugar-phosphatase